jgi:hypothetical protein
MILERTSAKHTTDVRSPKLGQIHISLAYDSSETETRGTLLQTIKLQTEIPRLKSRTRPAPTKHCNRSHNKEQNPTILVPKRKQNLKLLKGKASSSSNLGVILQRLRVHHRAQWTSGRPREDCNSLLLTHCKQYNKRSERNFMRTHAYLLSKLTSTKSKCSRTSSELREVVDKRVMDPRPSMQNNRHATNPKVKLFKPTNNIRNPPAKGSAAATAK